MKYKYQYKYSSALSWEEKGAGNPVGFMGYLSVTHKASIFHRGAKGATEKKRNKETQNDIASNYVSTTHAVHDYD